LNEIGDVLSDTALYLPNSLTYTAPLFFHFIYYLYY
jgi:predicted CDP-diglyceride synthetase/phosphatidate cytidylyltransferase